MDATAMEAARLATAAKDRWLNKDEIAFLLLHAKACQAAIPVYLSPQQQPPSGSLFFCAATMDYKKDGWTWQKKKGSETMVREDRAKLVVNRELVVLGAYAHSADAASFHRRSYVLRVGDPRYMLVHYLDDAKSKPRSPKLAPTPPLDDDCSTTFMEDVDLLGDMDLSSDPHAMQDVYDNLASFASSSPKMLPIPALSVLPETQAPLQITDYSPNWDFTSGGAKLLICTSETLPPATPFFVQFGAIATVVAESIASTVLRCTAPMTLEGGRVPLTIVTYRNGTVVPMSSPREFEYRGSTFTQALQDTDMLSDDTNETKSTLSEPHSMKRARSAVDDADVMSAYSDTTRSVSSPPVACTHQPFALDQYDHFTLLVAHERQYKIRVVERLSEFRRAISSKPTLQPTAHLLEESSPVLLDDSAVAALSDKELGSLSDTLIEDVVKQLVAVAGTSADLLEELNSLDDAGLSLLHYVSFYNCAPLVPLLLAHGALVDQRSVQGQTALHLAAGCGHLGVVKVLLAHNADVTMFDFDCLTPADRAENCGHDDVAAYLHSIVEPSPPKATSNLSFSELKSFGLFHDQDSSDQHNRKLLLGAFSTMSLHDKCALSLGTKRRSNSLGDYDEHDSDHDNMEVSSVMDDSDVTKLEAAMQLMGPDELALLEEEARVIQTNVRAWLLRRSYKHMRETTQKLQEVAKESIAKKKMERAAVTVQAATRSMLVRKSYLQQRNTAIKVQAAARGILCRKNFANMKKSALASLVIQKNVREWLAKPEPKSG